MGQGTFFRYGCLSLGALALVTTPSTAISAPKRRAAARTRTAAKPKPSNVEVLAGQLAINSQLPQENLAQTCRRSSFKNLAIALNMNRDLLHQEKGEYETTDQFNERVDKLANAVNGRQTVFCQPLDDNEDLPFSYNADRQAFEGSFEKHQNVWRDSKSLGTYKSKTRMGISATVHASAEFNYDVDLDFPAGLDSCDLTEPDYSSRYSFTLPIAVEHAPAFKDGGYMVFIGKLTSPYVELEEHSGNPTLDDPYDVYETNLTLHFRPSRIALVDGAGNVAWSCEPGVPIPNAPPRPKGDQSSWIVSYDYPYQARNEHRGGKVGVTVAVGSDGEPQACEVDSSSGYADFDEAACRALRLRSHFKPATDSQGNPTSGTWHTTITYNPQ